MSRKTKLIRKILILPSRYRKTKDNPTFANDILDSIANEIKYNRYIESITLFIDGEYINYNKKDFQVMHKAFKKWYIENEIQCNIAMCNFIKNGEN